jgi:hypothetical protein
MGRRSCRVCGKTETKKEKKKKRKKKEQKGKREHGSQGTVGKLIW